MSNRGILDTARDYTWRLDGTCTQLHVLKHNNIDTDPGAAVSAAPPVKAVPQSLPLFYQLNSLNGRSILIAHGLRQLQNFSREVRNHKGDLGGFCWKAVRVILDIQIALENKPVAILRQTRVESWSDHGTGN